MNSFRVIKYLLEGDTGMSSKALINQYIDSFHNTKFSHPYDCEDLKRCIDAVDSLDLRNVNHMKVVSSQWQEISEKWLELVKLFNTDKEECYNLLKECIY